MYEGLPTNPQLPPSLPLYRTVFLFEREYWVQLYYTKGSPAARPYCVRVGEPRRQGNPIFIVSSSQSQCRPIEGERSIDSNMVGAPRREARPGRPEGKKAGPQSKMIASLLFIYPNKSLWLPVRVRVSVRISSSIL